MPRSDRAERPRRGAWLGLLTLLAVVGTWVIGPLPASACSCVEPPAPRTALREADAVFTGEVTEISQPRGVAGRTSVVRLEVREVFTGEVGATTQVHTPSDSAACGHAFAVGRTELVYAVLDEEGRLHTNLCDRTAPVDEADVDLAALGEGEPPAATAQDGGQVGGWLVGAAATLLVAAAALVGAALRRNAAPR